MTPEPPVERKPRVLIADDQAELREIMTMALETMGADIRAVRDGAEAIALLRTEPFDLVVADQNMPGAEGTEVLDFVKNMKSGAPLFILVTAYGTLDLAVEAMRSGAYDFIKKPFEIGEFSNRVRKALDTLVLEEENRALRQAVEAHYVFSEIIGNSKPLREALELARRAADQPSPVLILGESGTGKDLVARAIHFHSVRRNKPFIPINCGAIPENLIESEFFGHRKGAFTGAISNRRGCFEEVAGGTLFLDEIGEMPFDMQVKLLRVLEERKIRRIGENKETPVEFRPVAATNRALEDLVGEGRFRQDLYYRLNVLTIDLPPLRERREDVIPLAEHFLKRAREETNCPVRAIAHDALEMLQNYAFPGNIRELANILERATLLCDGEVVRPEHLPPAVRGEVSTAVVETAAPAATWDPEDLDLKNQARRAQEAVEKRLIPKALDAAGGNHKRAADLLGISRGSLYNKLQRHGLERV